MNKDTEVLTKSGWVSLKDISPKEKIATLQDNGVICWSNFEIKKQQANISAIVSTLHTDLYILKDDFIFGKRRIKYKFQTKNGNHQNLLGRYRIPLAGDIANKDFNVSNEQIQLLAWIFTDGSFKNGSAFLFQSKPAGLKEIINLLKKLRINYSQRTRQRNTTEICGVKLKKPPLPSHRFTLEKEKTKFISSFMEENKKPKKDVFLKFSKQQLQLFIKTLLLGDGSVKPGKNYGALDGKKSFLDWTQSLCSISDVRSSLVNYKDDSWRLNINFNKNSTDLEISRKNLKKRQKSVVHWKIITPTGNCLIRNNGKSSFISAL